MNVFLNSQLIIDYPTDQVWDWVNRNFKLKNPEYIKKLKMGFWVGNTPEYIKLYSWDKRNYRLTLPFGTWRSFFKKFSGQFSVYSEIKPIEEKIDYHSNIKLYDYQEKISRNILKYKNGIVVAPCGAGKGLPKDAKVYTPNGFKRNGDLVLGDKVIGRDGNAYCVTGIFDKGFVPAYKITFSDETQIVCDKDHLWTVQKQTQRQTNPDKWFVKSAEEIFDHYQNIKRQDLFYIPIVDSVNFEEKKVDFNPWLLGFLLGDGCFREKGVSYSINEDDLQQKIIDIIDKEYNGKEHIKYRSKYDWYFVGGNILNKIRKLGLSGKRSYEKFIPDAYKYNSVEIRLAVLQGLFDADGYCGHHSGYEYVSTSKKLVEDILEIVQSLGGTGKITEKQPVYTYNSEKRTGKTAYRLYFKLYKFDPYTSQKHSKTHRIREKYKNAYRIIKKIEPCGEIDSRCITVSAKDELYVTDGFIVTHNTKTGLEACARIGGKTLWLTHTRDLMNQAKRNAEECFDLPKEAFGTITNGKANPGAVITFATVQTLSKMDLEQFRDMFDVIVTDECLPGDTNITTFEGTKKIKDIQIGDIVASFNTKKKCIEYKPVTHLFKYKAHDVIRLHLSNGQVISCTNNHPVYIKNKQWVEAGNVSGGDYVLQYMPQRNRFYKTFKNEQISLVKKRLWIRVESVEIQKSTSDGTFGGVCADGFVYNIEVADNNNYFADDILVHNCHHTSGTPNKVTMFYKVLSNLKARYKIGLTATPFRSDGMERSMYAILGEVIGEITRADIADRTCPLHIEAYDTYWAPDDQGEAFKEDGGIDYAKLIDDLTHDPDRLKLISDKINALKGPTLVLANRIEYLEQLQERYPKKSLCLSGMTPTKANKKKRDEALLQLDSGELDCVFSTFQLAKEGLDVPNLRYVVFATPEKDETTLIQSVGRVQRTAEGKKYGTVIDFCDNGFGLYAKWFDFRCSLYDHLFHADIKYIPADDYRTFL